VRVAVLALAAFLVAAAPAAADAPWSAPTDVSSAHEFIDNPELGFAKDGSGLASWTAADGVGGDAQGRGTFNAVLGRPEHLVSKTSVVSSPVLYATNRAVVITQRPAGGSRTRLSVVFGRSNTGLFGAPQTIATRANLRDPQIAANQNGDIAIAWFEDRGTFDDRVYLAFRPHGKPFTHPLLEATDRVRSVSVAVSPTGALLLAYDARGIIKERYKPASSPLFRRLQTIPSEPTFFARLRTAVTQNGRAYVAWAAQFLSEGGDQGVGNYQVAVQPAGATRFRTAQLLEQTPATVPVGNLDLVTNAANGATVAWGATTVRTATTNASGVFGAPTTIADGLEAALAGAPNGRTLVAYIAHPDDAGEGELDAALGGQPPERVTAGPAARVPAAAYDAHTNSWALVWSNRPNGETPPIRTVLQASTRPG
jgi:hypothetical protein